MNETYWIAEVLLKSVVAHCNASLVLGVAPGHPHLDGYLIWVREGKWVVCIGIGETLSRDEARNGKKEDGIHFDEIDSCSYCNC